MKISVIIPSYNRASLVERTINSVLAQSQPPAEILVVDDGSTDDTEEVVARFAEQSSVLVKYIRRKNGGLSAARNTGQENADPSCEGLLFLDSDDLMEPTMLALLERALASDSNAALAFCRARYINTNDKPIVIPNTALFDEPTSGNMWEHLLKGNCIRSAGGVLLRRDVLIAEEPWDESLSSNEDWDMWLRLAETGKRLICVPEPLLLYRVHGQSMSSNRDVMIQTRLRVFEKLLERHANDSQKIALIQSFYDQYRNEGGTEPSTIILTGIEAPLSYNAAMRDRHHSIRKLIERTGIASLYRKTPMAWRLRLRVLFGIDPNA